ncbi:Pfs NB-ARC and ankyrin domain protein [Fusarium beomiforme]|uniref:Pfs NB-ARC and ankyrin domain protein n=1 Tax=Fusarium beomiforme TaxID=44412 RepID=A0A9P5DWY3_9HYPO|nr:Pfs NB-ARC and ankyrin domain protein [Fusarium beomiforme]
MSGPSQLHQGGSEFASTINGHNVDLGNKSITRRDTAHAIYHNNYFGQCASPLESRGYENRAKKRKCNDNSEQSEDRSRYEILLKSLGFRQIDARHENIRNAHAKTCRWILKRAEYLDWLNPDKIHEHHGFLWIKGKPGAGKSTLMKFVLSNSRRRMTEKIIISFFFNARGEHLEKSTIGMYRSLLLQLLQKIPKLHNVLDPGLVLGISENHDWTVEVLRTLFEQAVESLGDSSVIVFIDALDECNESDIRSMVSSFKSLGDLSVAEGIRFHVCLASRHYPHITMPKKIELILEGQEGHEQDISSYLETELEIDKASGVFMWVVLVTGILQQKHDQGRIHELKKTLREIPGDLHELFRDILTRDDANKDELLLCTQWILFARQPLKPEQLYFAIRSYLKPVNICKWNRDEIEVHDISKFILSSSKGLAEITRTKQDPTVQFIHESVRDFLLKEDGLRVILMGLGENIQAESHEQLKKCCYDYTMCHMTDGALSSDLAKDELLDARRKADNEYPFLRYAVQNVLYHANTAEEGDISQTSFLRTFPLAAWIILNNLFEDKEVRRHTTRASLLYILAEQNLQKLVTRDQSSRSCFDIEDERYGAPVLAALATGCRPTIWELLKRETRNEPAESPLHDLCIDYSLQLDKRSGIGRKFKYNPRQDLLYYILKDGDLVLGSFAIASAKVSTSINFKTTKGETPFSVATHSRHDFAAVIQFLLNYEADIEARDTRGRTALCVAASMNSETAIQLLLNRGADVKAIDNNGYTPMTWSLLGAFASETVVRTLIDHGDTFNQVDFSGRTPVMHALNSESLIMKQLIDLGADIHCLDDKGQSALLLAVKAKRSGHAELLIKHHACTNVVDSRNGRTVLSYAVTTNDYDLYTVSSGHPIAPLGSSFGSLSYGVVEAILSNNAVVDTPDADGRKPLSHAAQDRFRGTNFVSLLLDHGGDVNKADNNGRTPLSYAASRTDPGATDCVQLLLDRGAIPSIADKDGRAPDSYSAFDVVRRLLSARLQSQ